MPFPCFVLIEPSPFQNRGSKQSHIQETINKEFHSLYFPKEFEGDSNIVYNDLGRKYHLSYLFFSHTASSLGLTSVKPLGKAFSASLPIMSCLLPQISPRHQPPFLSSIFFAIPTCQS